MRRFPLLAAATFTLFFSCSDETTVYEDPNNNNNLRLESNENILESSIVYDEAGVLDILDEATITGKFASSSKVQPAGDYPLTLVAQVDVPSFQGGQNLTASHVVVDGDYAYVSYNTVDANFVGAVDIVNVKNPTNPRVTSRLYYTNADINAIAYDNGYVYLAGGVDSELSVTATANSFVAKIMVYNGRFDLDSGITYGFQEGYNATDVEVVANKVIVTSGQEGFVRVYNKSDLSTIVEAPYLDLRAVAANESNIAVLDASAGVSILDQSLNTIKDIAIDSDFGVNTKRTLDFYGENIIVSEGSKGAGVYNGSNGSFVEYIPILLDPETVDDSDVVTNAVATNEDVLLMANGGAGLCLSENKDTSADTSLVGIIQLEGSINFVASKDDYIFAASGLEGLQIIKLNRPDESLVARCSDLIAYSGSANLNVNGGENLSFRGSKRFNSLNIGGSLLLCGSWTVKENVNINQDALFEMNGTFVVGRNNRKRNVNVNNGAKLRVEGNLTIYGDLVLNDGATIEFIGENSVANIFGRVIRNGDTNVSGTFRDVRNKFQ
ncbi:hypothetical protein PP182_06785 [Maribacter sp. PR1]|uniref:LVIVD repeat-containing protein n=1 Tax=Maribacter cobaltidurans TaxID=1178778 RepID=A0ABU7IT23_9FLAO|nr:MULTISPECIES: hypothetical protein [Maribacter]MDC6388379.1 hypothetical protein [Maribacter sp. PR1]MEE1975768.1 hypothetical protein [Maribacter cobaltidurans]